VAYYHEMGSGHASSLHRGDQSGPVICETELCEEKQGTSKIELKGPHAPVTISLEHIPRRALIFPPKTTFIVDGKDYYWKGYSDVFDQKTDKLVAQYHVHEGSGDIVAELLLVNDKKMDKDKKQLLYDVIVTSTFLMQQRSEARTRAVCLYSISNLTVGIGVLKSLCSVAVNMPSIERHLCCFVTIVLFRANT
jgi:hypothetical protein